MQVDTVYLPKTEIIEMKVLLDSMGLLDRVGRDRPFPGIAV